MIRRFLSRFLSDSGGSAAAEMMLVMPILFALMFTAFEGGHYMWTEHKALKGVRDGARYAARLPFEYYNCDNDAPADPDGIRDPVTDIQNLTRTGTIVPTPSDLSKVPGWANDHVKVSVVCREGVFAGLYDGMDADGDGKPEVPTVTVSTVVRYPSILGLLGFDTTDLGVRAQASAAVTGL
jgi:hypothetical protein